MTKNSFSSIMKYRRLFSLMQVCESLFGATERSCEPDIIRLYQPAFKTGSGVVSDYSLDHKNEKNQLRKEMQCLCAAQSR